MADAIREYTDPGMEREEMLRAMYLHVRDDFTYLRRNYYQVSDIGWAMKEALTMYSTGRGNCYCYAAAFWTAARGLGYDATVVTVKFGGGGHKGAAGASIKLPLEEAAKAVEKAMLELE